MSDNVDIETYELDIPDIPFEHSLAAIHEDAIAPFDLLGFGDISRKQIHELRAAWRSLPREKREVIAEVALMLARDQPYADFGKFFRVLLEDADTAVRLHAATGAALSEDEDLIKPLVEIAEGDSEVDIREAAIDALGVQVVGLDAGFVADHADVARLLRLKVWAQDLTWPNTLRAASLAAYSHLLEDEETEEIIRAFVQQDDEVLQLGAMRAMSAYGTSQFTRFLERQLQNIDVDAREAAANAMGMSDDQAVVPMLTMAARTDSEPAVREAAYLALAKIGTKPARRSLVQLRNHASDDEIEIIDEAIEFIDEMDELASADGFDMFDFEADSDREF